MDTWNMIFQLVFAQVNPSVLTINSIIILLKFSREWIVIFLSIMNWINVSLQMPCLRKCLSTIFTFVSFLTIVNWINMYRQFLCFRKCLSTWVTFVIFLTIVNWIDVSLHISWLGKYLSARVTFMLLLICMNTFQMHS